MSELSPQAEARDMELAPTPSRYEAARRSVASPRFFIVTLRLFATRGFAAAQTKPAPATRGSWAFAFASLHPRCSRRLRASLTAPSRSP